MTIIERRDATTPADVQFPPVQRSSGQSLQFGSADAGSATVR
jgi:hypothetical protein